MKMKKRRMRERERARENVLLAGGRLYVWRAYARAGPLALYTARANGRPGAELRSPLECVDMK